MASKDVQAFAAIRRFSEDIDLSFDRADLGYIGERDPEREGISRKQPAGSSRISPATSKIPEFMLVYYPPGSPGPAFAADQAKAAGLPGLSWDQG